MLRMPPSWAPSPSHTSPLPLLGPPPPPPRPHDPRCRLGPRITPGGPWCQGRAGGVSQSPPRPLLRAFVHKQAWTAAVTVTMGPPTPLHPHHHHHHHPHPPPGLSPPLSPSQPGGSGPSSPGTSEVKAGEVTPSKVTFNFHEDDDDDDNDDDRCSAMGSLMVVGQRHERH
ncbi:hypothetical protein O3P69_019506 [Scylla paramamosain]|uniref:Uncharacterized protein n=1 Tax=Scylla paramamosain TaxID=85552 RepID=A0AAW0SWW9_SCYPA